MAYTLKYYFDSATNSYYVTGYENITLSDIVVIPDKYDGPVGSRPVTKIDNQAFNDCRNLTSVVIGNNVTSIGIQAFSQCISLTRVTIGNSVTSINDRAFHWCGKLTSITIPDSVTTIGPDAFNYCTHLEQVILFPSTPPTLGSANSIPNNVQTIYVLRESNEAYKGATDWTALSSKIVSDNLYLSFVRFNAKNKKYIDSGLSKKLTVLDDGRVKVQSAPTEDDDVVRLNELFELTQEQVDSLF